MLELFDLVLFRAEPEPLGPAAELLCDRLRDGPLTADELVRASGLDPAQTSAALLELELARRVVLEDGVYRAPV